MRAAGVPDGPVMGVALSCIPRAVKQLGRERRSRDSPRSPPRPNDSRTRCTSGRSRSGSSADQREADRRFVERDAPAPFADSAPTPSRARWSRCTTRCGCRARVRGALMPDAHRGYGLPIGGVLATENTVIPYAVGVDIACRMKLSRPRPARRDARRRARTLAQRAAQRETQFGDGRRAARSAPSTTVLDADAGRVTPLTREPARQGRGPARHERLRQPLRRVRHARRCDERGPRARSAGSYLALLSHSGSRGPGAQSPTTTPSWRGSCTPSCRKELAHLAWLDLDCDAGQEYWAAMNLMGDTRRPTTR